MPTPIPNPHRHVSSSTRPMGSMRLLRYCVRPPFAMDRLRKEGDALHNLHNLHKPARTRVRLALGP